MKRRSHKLVRTAVLPLLGGCIVIALLAALQAGLFQPRLQRLIRQLQTAKEAEDRYEAARQLGEIGDDARPAVPSLVAALADGGRHVTATMMIFPREHYVRHAAYQALKKIGGVETVHALGRIITQTCADERKLHEKLRAETPTSVDEPDWNTACMAVRLLAEFGPEARPASVTLLDAIDGCRQGEVVKLSLAALDAMELEPESAAAEKAREVLPQFCHWGGDTGRTSARLLYRLWPEDDEVLEHYVRAWLGGSPATAAGVIPINERTVPLLIGHLGDGTRDAAMAELAAAEPERVVPALREALGRSEWLVRAGAASVLARHGVSASAAEPELTRMLDDENLAARQAAAMALWHVAHKIEPLLPVLVAAQDSEDPHTRLAAQTFLNERGDTDAWAAVPLVRCATSCDSKEQRLLALKILTRIGRPASASAPALLELLRNADPDIQRAAAQAVAALEGA